MIKTRIARTWKNVAKTPLVLLRATVMIPFIFFVWIGELSEKALELVNCIPAWDPEYYEE